MLIEVGQLGDIIKRYLVLIKVLNALVDNGISGGLQVLNV